MSLIHVKVFLVAGALVSFCRVLDTVSIVVVPLSPAQVSSSATGPGQTLALAVELCGVA